MTPQADVAPNQGALLAIIAKIAGARRALEFGTLAGYSTIWLARAVGPEGKVVTLEADEPTAAIARRNFENAGVAGSVELIIGPAAESVQRLIGDNAVRNGAVIQPGSDDSSADGRDERHWGVSRLNAPRGRYYRVRWAVSVVTVEVSPAPE